MNPAATVMHSGRRGETIFPVQGSWIRSFPVEESIMDRNGWHWVVVLMAFIVPSAFVACALPPERDGTTSSAEDDLLSSVPCSVTAARYPTTPEEMMDVYAGRSFYADGNHLGHDIRLAEGAPIHPIGCGILRVYRPAAGYGELAAVVEHHLPEARTFTNGMGEAVTVESFLTIYGHIRKSPTRDGSGATGLKPGDMVGPDDVIGYVNDDAHNGDGREHLHFGVRLQSASDAEAVDAAWFRGYDGNPSQRRWFADPVPFLAALTSSALPVSWHPPGTFLRRPIDDSVWFVDAEGERQLVDPGIVASERLAASLVDAMDAELGCLDPAEAYVSPRMGTAVMKFDDASTVYEYRLGTDPVRFPFISYEAFVSWGWRDADIAVWPASERDAFFASTIDKGLRLMRDGSLVKAQDESEVSVVSEGRRLPIADWPTFLALGYRPESIIELPPSTIEEVAGPRGPLITPETIAACAHPSACLDDCPPPGNGGGTGEELPDGPDDPADPPDDSGEDPPETSPPVPPGKLRFRYDGPIVPGMNQFQGMWDPPGEAFHDWVPDTFALCPDQVPDDGVLECLLDMPPGTTGFLFTVHLPDGRWWGDMSCDPTGGCGSTIGTVALEASTGPIAYEMRSNGSGPAYMNGFVAVIP